MSSRAVNLALLVLVLLELTSGGASFLVGGPDGRWVFWAHAVGGIAIIALLPLKFRISLRSYGKRGVGLWAVAPTVLSVLFLGTLATGILWATTGLPRVPVPGGLVNSWSGLSLHIALGVALLPLLLIHTVLRWPKPRPVDFVGRRALLRTGALLGVGALAWQGVEGMSGIASLPGSRRRFTGSYEKGSFAGNAHPVTNWLSDTRQRIDEKEWRLRVSGEVERELELTYDNMMEAGDNAMRATLDCTGGWYTVQDWKGVPLARVLDDAGIRDGAQSVVVRSATGYDRRFGMSAAKGLLLATHVSGEVLSAGHGFPVRLVAPNRRGYNWVKWVTEIEVSGDHPLWQPPLPLQ